MGNAPSLAIAVAVPLAGGLINGFLTQKDILGWYKKLKKPTWNPPNWLFGPAWGILYISMGAASWFVFKAGGANRTLPLALYAAQLALNWAWQPLFFKLHRLDIALADAAAMVGVTAAATVSMAQVAGAAPILPLMLPYLSWISFATVLNYRLLQLNPEADKIPTDSIPDQVKEGAQKLKEGKDAAVKKVGEVKDAVSDKVDAAAEKVSGTADAVAKKVDEAKAELKDAADKAGEAADQAADTAQQVAAS